MGHIVKLILYEWFEKIISKVISMRHSFYGPYLTKVVVEILIEVVQEKPVDHAIWDNVLNE